MLAPASLLALLVAAPTHDGGASFPAHFEAVPLPGQVNKAVDLAFLEDGRFFLTGKNGEVHFHTGSVLQESLVLDLTDEIVHTGDRGLIGLAVPPGYAPDASASSWIYLAYTVSPVPGEDPLFDEDQKHAFSRVVRYRTDTVADDVLALEGTRQVLLGSQLADGTVPDGIATLWSSHAVGSLVFGADGSLLISAGDGAHADQLDAGGLDPAGFDDFVHPDTGLRGPMPADQDCGAYRAQDLRSLSGKILRVDPETGLGYPSNPFWDGDPASPASRVWALGLRNPCRMDLVPGTGSSDPGDGAPGRLYVGDVGWNGWEELNRCDGGENFGWPCAEGPLPHAGYGAHSFEPNPLGCPDCASPGPGVPTDPLVTWNHEEPGLLEPLGVHVAEDGVPQPGFTGSAAIAGATYVGGEYPAEYEGLFFFADYADQWIRSLALDGSGAVAEVADFGFDVGRLVDLERHPVTGDLHYVDLGAQVGQGRVYRVRHGANLTPAAAASAAPTFGDPPLLVTFDGGASSDPEDDPLTYAWDFGDGSPPASGPRVQHTYTDPGLFEATLTVTDDGGLSDTAVVPIASGDVPPVATILTPLPGTTFVDHQPLLLSGTGTDFAGGPLEYEWTIDLYHDTHVHPDQVTASGPTATYVVEPHGTPDELFYLRIGLTVESVAGLTGTDHVYVYTADNLVDATGGGRVISRVDELVPPIPTGAGNLDPEVVRDALLPPAGATNRQWQFDTFHGGDQGDDDWIGLELDAPPDDDARFTSLLFQEGLHFAVGGWFEDFRVEVRDGGVWTEVEDLVALPPYPFELAHVPGFDGVGFETYELHFDPTHGDAIRLRGTPGGSVGFVSAGELRVRLIEAREPSPWRDLTEAGSWIAAVEELDPPGPQGDGNPDPFTALNGTTPPVGSDSVFAQYDTFHGGDQAGEDWVGLAFADWQTFTRVVLQEGFHFPGGGWFAAAGVEVRAAAGEPWQPVSGLSVAPPFPGDTGLGGTYETFELAFDPVAARELRVVGPPGGADGFVSVGELRVFGPAFDEQSCGWTPYGEELGGTNVLTLRSTTPAVLAHPAVLEVAGAPGSGFAAVLLSASSLVLPVAGGTLLVDPVGATVLSVGLGAGGAGELAGALPSSPALAGTPFYLQALAPNPADPETALFSNGLELRLCE